MTDRKNQPDKLPESAWLHPVAIWLAYCGFVALAGFCIILWRST